MSGLQLVVSNGRIVSRRRRRPSAAALELSQPIWFLEVMAELEARRPDHAEAVKRMALKLLDDAPKVS